MIPILFVSGLEQDLNDSPISSTGTVEFNYKIKLENMIFDECSNQDTNDIHILKSESPTAVIPCDASNQLPSDVYTTDYESKNTSQSTTGKLIFDECLTTFQAIVQLDNLMPKLESSKKYCKNCKILFPSIQSLIVHNNNLHTTSPVASAHSSRHGHVAPSCSLENNQRKKEVILKVLTRNHDKPPVSENSLYYERNEKCQICHQRFTNKRGLAQHKVKVHSKTCIPKRNKTLLTKTQEDKTGKTQTSKQHASNTKYICVHCNKQFPNQEYLINHLYDVLQSTKNGEKKCLKRNSNTQFCNKNKSSANKKIKQVNQIKKKSTVSVLMENAKCTTFYFRCSICFYYFKGLFGYKKHLVLNHQLSVAHAAKKLPQRMVFNGQCKRCPLTMRSIYTLNQHIKRQHPNIFNYAALDNSNNQSTKEDKKINETSDLEREELMENNRVPQFENSVDSISELQNDKSMKIAKVLLIDNVFNSGIFKQSACNEKSRDSDMKLIAPTPGQKTNAEKFSSSYFRCSTCSGYFKWYIRYQDHIRLYHKLPLKGIPKKVKFDGKCKYCSSVFLSADSFNRHIKTKHNTGTKNRTEGNIDLKKPLVNHQPSQLNEHMKSIDFTSIKSKDILSNNDHPKDSHTTDDKRNAISIKTAKGKQRKTFKRQIKKKSTLSDKNNDFKTLFKMFYCKVCTCYLTVANASKHEEHVVKKWICRSCGLVLPINSCAHFRLHKKYPNLKLGDFDFFEFGTDKEIIPPIPEYFKCIVCDVHFLSQASHECSGDNYLTCHICQIKLSEEAFKLHFYFHNYFKSNPNDEKLKNSISQMLWNESEAYLPQYSNLNEISKSLITTSENEKNSENAENSEKTDNTVVINAEDVENSHSENTEMSEYVENAESEAIIYLCRNCFVAVDSYDKVVEHCQEHYSPTKKEIMTDICTICDLKFDHTCYNDHQKLHLPVSDKISFNVLKFDSFYFTSENNIWVQHVLGSLPQKKKDEILAKSVYGFECRIKMETIQEGNSGLTMYKCYKCGCFIDYFSLHRHAENACFKLRKHPCSICGLPFISSFIRLEHEKIHKKYDIINSKSYRIVIFNREEDKECNSLYSRKNYVLYQCRNCQGTVDKFQVSGHKCMVNDLQKCLHCGLLLHSEDYMRHVLRHTELVNFNYNYIDIMLFGKIDDSSINSKHITPSFKGSICDFKLYKCKKCQVCLESVKSRHICPSFTGMSQCTICGLYFLTSRLKNHQALVHQMGSDFVKEQMMLIPYDFQCNESVASVNFEESSKPDKETIDVSEIFEDQSNENVEEAVKGKKSSEVKVALSATDEKTVDDSKPLANVVFSTSNEIVADYNLIGEGKASKNVKVASSAIVKHAVNASKKIEGIISTNVEVASSATVKHTLGASKKIEEKISSNLHKVASSATEQAVGASKKIEGKISVNVEAMTPKINKQSVDNSKLCNGINIDSPNTVNIDSKSVAESSYCSTQAKIATLYRCTCGLHFLDKPSITIHFKLCSPKIRTSRQTCSKCDLSFTPNILFSHFISHHGNKNTTFKYNIINMGTKSKETQVFYKCSKCKLYFEKEINVNEHVEKCEGSGTEGKFCSICNLIFDAISLDTHEHINDQDGRKHYQVISVTAKSIEQKSVASQPEVSNAVESKDPSSDLKDSD